MVTFKYIVTSMQSISVWLTIIAVIAKDIGRKIFRGWGNIKTKTKKLHKLSSICPFYQWQIGGALSMHPGLTSKECCITIRNLA